MPDMPDRYEVQQSEFQGEQQKSISLRERGIKGNRLFMVQGFDTQVKDIKKKTAPNKMIYLDGACQKPYYDAARGIYSLDHHEGCVRQITDSACEQALKLARTRVIKSDGYRIAGNDPDLDTILAGWATLNADQLAYDDSVFRKVQPLFILQGNIDALGLGYEELTGLSEEQIRSTRSRINWLMKEERDLKMRGRWQNSDFIDYTERTLRKVDQYALYADTMDVPADINAHEVIGLENGQEVHYTLAPQSGIYEVENTVMKHMEKKDCACIVFTDGKAKWTVKLTGFVNGFNLSTVFKRLDEEETMAKERAGIKDEKLMNAHWGGGGTIGGPPRYYSGIKPFVQKDRILEIIIEELNKQITTS